MKTDLQNQQFSLNQEEKLKWSLRFGAFFMLVEAIFHASGVRLQGLESIWPADAYLFAWFMLMLWAMASLFIAVVIWIISTNIQAYKIFLLPITFVLVIHGLLLYYVSFLGVEQIFSAPALYVWNPWYSWQLRLEGLALHAFSGLVLWNSFKKS